MPLKNDGTNIDPYNHVKRLEKWESKTVINGISKFNSDLIIDYIGDMKLGLNTARRKPLTPIRLNSIRQRVVWITKHMQEIFKKDKITEITEKEATIFFNDLMRNGKIRNKWNKKYLSIDSYATNFKAFWHWYMRRENSNGNNIKDITTYVDTSPMQENTFAYFTIDDLKKVSVIAKYKYKVLMWFLFDSGIRSPTELMNIKVSDLSKLESSNNFELNIRNDISKTFGRKIKLMLCSDLLKGYISSKCLKDNDYLFKITPRITNQYFKRLFEKVLGTYVSKGGENINSVSLYDFRHASACYWVSRYKSLSALLYRFGWKSINMSHRYTKLLGMKDTIEEKDLILDSEIKTKLETDLESQKQKNELLEEQMQSIQKDYEALSKKFESFDEIKQLLKEKLANV